MKVSPRRIEALAPERIWWVIGALAVSAAFGRLALHNLANYRPLSNDEGELMAVGSQDRTLTARAATSTTVRREVIDWRVIKILAHGVIGMVSVGLNAVAFVNATYR